MEEQSKTTQNDLKQPTTSKKRTEPTYNEHETVTRNDLQRAVNDLKWSTTSRTQPRPQQRPEPTNNKEKKTRSDQKRADFGIILLHVFHHF